MSVLRMSGGGIIFLLWGWYMYVCTLLDGLLGVLEGK